MPAKKPRNVVFDSGVLVSAFLTPRGLAAELLRRCGGAGVLFLSEAILDETRNSLTQRPHIRTRYRFTDEQVERFLKEARDLAEIVAPVPEVRAVEKDPKDDVILATALAANARVLVARDSHLLDLETYRTVAILTPEAFIGLLREEEATASR